jgi:chromosome segregation ATPase
MAQARIQSPDVIRQFRGRFVAFDESCRKATMGTDAALKKTAEWLKGEQQLAWKREVRKLENEVNLAQNEYNRQRFTAGGKATNALVDAKKALDKVRRRKEEAEARLEATKRWAVRLEAETEKLVATVRGFEVMLEELVPKGLSRLDRMVESLEEYLKTAPGENA